MKFTASTFVDINSKWLELGFSTCNRVKCAQQAMAKIPALLPSNRVAVNEVGTDSQAEYVHRIQSERAVPFVKRRTARTMKSARSFTTQRVTMQMVHGVLVVGCPNEKVNHDQAQEGSVSEVEGCGR